MVRILAFVLALASCAVLAASGAATAYGRGTSTPGQSMPPSASAAQTPEQLLAMTDEVARQVEAMRGWTFKQPVKKELTTPDQVRQYLEQQAAKSLPDGKAQREQALLRTIGLIPPTMDLKKTWLAVLESQVAGFYDPDTKTMHLVNRQGMPLFVERITLAHELTHALDDQYVDLQAFTKSGDSDTDDLELTTQSVVEGSATALMMQYAARAMMSGGVDQKALQEYGQQEADRNKAFLEAPRYFSAMLGAYICGTQFLARGQLMALLVAPDDKAIGEALLAARKEPPSSTEQILHPAKYWDAAKRDDPVVVDDAAAGAWLAQPGRWVVATDTIGEMLIAILTSAPGTKVNLQNMQPNAWTNAAATGWGGDRFYLLASGDSVENARAGLKDLKGVWVTAWDTPKDRDEFLAALPTGSLPAGAAGHAVGPSVAVVCFGIDAPEQAALTARLRDKPLAMTRSGKAWDPGQ